MEKPNKFKLKHLNLFNYIVKGEIYIKSSLNLIFFLLCNTRSTLGYRPQIWSDFCGINKI